MIPVAPTRWRQLRLSALTATLLLALIVSGALAFQAVKSERLQREAAAQALTDYSDFAAFVLASGVYREAGIRVLTTFGSLPPWNTPALFTRPGANLGCGAQGVYFEYEPQTGVLRHAPGAFSPEAVQRITDTLQHAQRLFNEAAWRFREVRLPRGDAGDAMFIAPGMGTRGFGVRGLTSCIWADTVFTNTVEHWSALPPSMVGEIATDSLYGVTIAPAGGAPVLKFGGEFGGDFGGDFGGENDTPLTGSTRLGPEFGDLRLTVTLNPRIASGLLIGGTPPTRGPSALLLFALSAILLAAAVTLIVREYRAIDARSEFVASVSHELRTPLSQILLFTELLRLGRLDDTAERTRALGIIDAEARRLIRLVENILQFSRRPTVRPLTTESLPLGAHVRDTVDAFGPLAAARKVTIDVEIPATIQVRGERNALRQVLLNLLDNAVKYGPEGQRIRFEARHRVGAPEIELLVDDQGPGIPTADRARIWEGFERLERDDVPVAGSGIGLAVVRSLVARMGGRTAVADAPTGGARFIITLAAAGRES
jgi:signal transduction histidine kinase